MNEVILSEHSRRERKKQETRERLLEAAWQRFRAQGYANTTIEEITEAADVAKGTFFNYFESKEVLLGEVVSWQIRGEVERALTGEDVPRSAVGRLKRVVLAMLERMRPDGELACLLFGSPIDESVRHETIHRMGRMVERLVEEGQVSGEIRADVEAELVVRLLMTCVFFNSARWHEAEVKFSLADRLIESIDMLMDGLGGPQWRRV